MTIFSAALLILLLVLLQHFPWPEFKGPWAVLYCLLTVFVLVVLFWSTGMHFKLG